VRASQAGAVSGGKTARISSGSGWGRGRPRWARRLRRGRRRERASWNPRARGSRAPRGFSHTDFVANVKLADVSCVIPLEGKVVAVDLDALYAEDDKRDAAGNFSAHFMNLNSALSFAYAVNLDDKLSPGSPSSRCTSSTTPIPASGWRSTRASCARSTTRSRSGRPPELGPEVKFTNDDSIPVATNFKAGSASG